MYAAVPPQLDPAPKLDEAWGVRRGVRLDFPGPAALADNAVHTELLRAYLADMLTPYGLALDAEKLAVGGQSYGEMAEALVRLTVSENEPVDLLVLVSAIPDITPGRSTAIYLSHICPGTPMAFALSDQGPVAAFTGLKLISEFARTDGLRRALLLVLEQAVLPYDTGGAPMPTTSSGIALLLGGDLDNADADAGSAPLASRSRQAQLDAVRVLAGTRSPEVALADALDVNSPDATVILGQGLTSCPNTLDSAARVRVARSGQPGTGVWWDFLGELSEPCAQASTSRCLVLADYDADAAALCLASFSAR